MDKEIKEIFSENPIDDQWQILLRFAYASNIKKYFADKAMESPQDNLLETISNSFQQAYEYYNAVQAVSLNISPLLIYYGTTNLLLATCSLIARNVPVIKNHGMQLLVPSNSARIADIEIRITNPQDGAFCNFNKILCDNNYEPSGEKWSLLESLGAILELKDDFENVYDNQHSFVMPLKVIRKKDEKYWLINHNSTKRFSSPKDIFNVIPNFNKNYLPPGLSQRNSNLIIRQKLNGIDLSDVSISGESYFALSSVKNNRLYSLSLVSRLFIGLYALGFLSRYYPEKWAPFIKTDSTGEKQIIEKFLQLAKRYVPNICLNLLYDKKYVFVDHIDNVKDISGNTAKEEFRELIKEEIALFMKNSKKEGK
jgi:hypothetical protein